MNPCTGCGSNDWEHVLTDSYSGHKDRLDRSDTRREVYVCDSCGAEGRRFVDGVDNNVTFSGALRGESA